jgi:hypothetical protein
VHYHFTTVDVMRAMIAADEFIEHAEVHGNFYGTSKAAVQAVCNAGKVCILDIDVQGVQQVYAATPDKAAALFVFIQPTSMVPPHPPRNMHSTGTATNGRTGTAPGRLCVSTRIWGGQPCEARSCPPPSRAVQSRSEQVSAV